MKRILIMIGLCLSILLVPVNANTEQSNTDEQVQNFSVKSQGFDLTNPNEQIVDIKDDQGKTVTLRLAKQEPQISTYAWTSVNVGNSFNRYFELTDDLYTMGAYVSGVSNGNNGDAYFTNIYSPSFTSIMGTENRYTVGITKKYNNSGTPARAEYNVWYSLFGGTGGQHLKYLYFDLYSNGYMEILLGQKW